MDKENRMSKDEQIGFHKGSLTTLANERQELIRIVQVVEQLMGMHAKALEDLGVKLEKPERTDTRSTPSGFEHAPKPAQPTSQKEPPKKRSFDEMLDDNRF